jgi:UDP-glucose 4-epimerase
MWLPESQVVQIAWADDSRLRQLCVGMDAVVHLAGMNARDCVLNPAEALAFNGGATARLARAAIDAGVARMLYLSTAHVYASPLIGIISEETKPTSHHPYATSHLAGEEAVIEANNYGWIEGVVVRLSNAFGAPTHPEVDCWSLLVNDITRQAVETGRMTLHSLGTQRRDFIAMSEVCRSLTHLLSMRADLIGDGLFNVGGGWSPTVIEIAEYVAARFARDGGKPITIQCPHGGVDEPPIELLYRRQRLIDSGYVPGNGCTVDEEIDSLVRFCQQLAV